MKKIAIVTTFENELRKIFNGVENLENKKYVGRALYASIDNEIKFKAEFISTNSYDHYDALRFKILHRDGNELDACTIRLKEIWGMKSISNGNFPNGVSPHMWIDRGELKWYAYTPHSGDYEQITDQITEYVDVFQDVGIKQEMRGMDEIGM